MAQSGHRLHDERLPGESAENRAARELAFAPRDPGHDPRHIDAIRPMWAALDFTPVGRGADTHPRLSYD